MESFFFFSSKKITGASFAASLLPLKKVISRSLTAGVFPGTDLPPSLPVGIGGSNIPNQALQSGDAYRDFAAHPFVWDSEILARATKTPRPSAGKYFWRRGELNPCPRRVPRKHLHVYPALNSEKPTSHRRAASFRASAKRSYESGAV